MDALAVATFLMVGATLLVVYFTYKLASEAKESSLRQIGVQMWVEMQTKFDSKEMEKARKTLAAQFLSPKPARHDKVSERLLNFFEDVGLLYRKGFIDKELSESSFSFYVCRWWEACKSYVDEEQKRHKEDGTLFEHFRNMAEAMRQPGEIIDDGELKKFLEDETKLVTE